MKSDAEINQIVISAWEKALTPEKYFKDEVLKGLQSIDTNLSLILKVLQKPIKTKKKTK